jgi:hypothetical protein
VGVDNVEVDAARCLDREAGVALGHAEEVAGVVGRVGGALHGSVLRASCGLRQRCLDRVVDGIARELGESTRLGERADPLDAPASLAHHAHALADLRGGGGA